VLVGCLLIWDTKVQLFLGWFGRRPAGGGFGQAVWGWGLEALASSKTWRASAGGRRTRVAVAAAAVMTGVIWLGTSVSALLRPRGCWWWGPTFASVVMRLLRLMLSTLDFCWGDHGCSGGWGICFSAHLNASMQRVSSICLEVLHSSTNWTGWQAFAGDRFFGGLLCFVLNHKVQAQLSRRYFSVNHSSCGSKSPIRSRRER